MEALRLFRSLTRDQRNTFMACFLGWALDALDFFLLTFVMPAVATDFNCGVPQIALALTVTLMMRPVGAAIFGYLGDRFGRRIPLMIDIVFYSVMELLTAFAPNYTVFLVLRALFGIGMGGEWGLGASLAMEALPARARGLFSGILQQGYAVGYLLAAVVFWLVFPVFGWRGMFIAGALPALLVLYIRAHVPESPVWQRDRDNAQMVTTARSLVAELSRHWKLFLYAVLLMTAFMYMSHGTQDIYPTFLEKQRGLGVDQKTLVTVFYSVGAICGGTFFGYLSQKLGRRRAIIGAAVLGLILIPAWVFAPNLALLIAGGFGMQFMVQGAWGVVPVHLNELAPAACRGTFAGLTYQLGAFFSANAAFIQASIAERMRDANGAPDYAKTLAIFMATVFLALIVITALGREERGREF
ncbi:MAG TPA: MFS transporter [Chthoniobacterales bacterium]|nr:MFS transporter [Chthoniobacterales bacterium]